MELTLAQYYVREGDIMRVALECVLNHAIFDQSPFQIVIMREDDHDDRMINSVSSRSNDTLEW